MNTTKAYLALHTLRGAILDPRLNEGHIFPRNLIFLFALFCGKENLITLDNTRLDERISDGSTIVEQFALKERV